MEWYVWLLIFLVIAALAYAACNIWEVFFLHNGDLKEVAKAFREFVEKNKRGGE